MAPNPTFHPTGYRGPRPLPRAGELERQVPWSAAAVKVRALFSNRLLYLGWAVVSAAGLAIAAYIHPHVFGFCALGAAFLSGLLVLGAAILSWRNLVWAAVAAIPTVLAIQLLSTYQWA